MPALVNKIMLITYTEVAFPQHPGGRGVNITYTILDKKAELPVAGCVDFTIVNQGTSKVYLFGSAIEILPGQSWSPPKSTALPIANKPRFTFENDYEISRNIADLTSNSSQQSN